MSGVIVGAFIWATQQKALKEYTRIIYFHVPVSWITVLAFLIAAVYSFLYLKKRLLKYDAYAEAANQLGFLFAVLATVTGSIWAKVSWGTFWNWDPRETSIFILLLIYAAYFALRSAIEEQDRRAILSSVYAILAFVTVPFFVFIVPRIYFSLHPDPVINQTGEVNMDFKQRVVFFSSLITFTAVFVWMLKTKFEIAVMRLRIKKLEREK
ncbi:MAG: cytochrome C biogenesis protein [Caldithrix sp.]|nr:cytochrome C biogenesis protein [Caldithrix sp.]